MDRGLIYWKMQKRRSGRSRKWKKVINLTGGAKILKTRVRKRKNYVQESYKNPITENYKDEYSKLNRGVKRQVIGRIIVWIQWTILMMYQELSNLTVHNQSQEKYKNSTSLNNILNQWWILHFKELLQETMSEFVHGKILDTETEIKNLHRRIW